MQLLQGVKELSRPDIALTTAAEVERAKGIEPSSSAWEAEVLPLNYAPRE